MTILTDDVWDCNYVILRTKNKVCMKCLIYSIGKAFLEHAMVELVYTFDE